MKLNTIIVYEKGQVSILRSGQVGSCFELSMAKVTELLKRGRVFEDIVNVSVCDSEDNQSSAGTKYSEKAYKRAQKILKDSGYQVRQQYTTSLDIEKIEQVPLLESVNQ